MNVIPDIALLTNCIDEAVEIEQSCIADLVTKYLDCPTTELESEDLSCLTDRIHLSIALSDGLSVKVSLNPSANQRDTRVVVRGLPSRALSTTINENLALHLLQEQSELALYDVFQAAKTMVFDSTTLSLQEKSSDITLSKPQAHPDVNGVLSAITTQTSCYSRVMFYAHHLLATSKRQDLKRLAVSLDLHVVIKVGYPGLIAAEGERSYIEMFKQEVKGMRWHTITLKYEMLTNVKGQQTWLDYAILSDTFFETNVMNTVAARLMADRKWFMSIMH